MYIQDNELVKLYTIDKPAFYQTLSQSLSGLIEGEADAIANFSNASALIYQNLTQINWAGFYRLKEGELVLGPFQGKPACIRIALKRGVCGAAASQKKTQRIEDVHAFPGHIACDPDSASEIVIPILKEGQLVGVLDIDSPVKGRFDREDQAGLEAFAKVLSDSMSLSSLFF